MKSVVFFLAAFISTAAFAKAPRSTYKPPSCDSDKAVHEGLVKIQNLHPGKEITYTSEWIKDFDEEGNFREYNGGDVIKYVQFVYAFKEGDRLQVKRTIQPADKCETAALIEFVPKVRGSNPYQDKVECTRDQIYQSVIDGIKRDHPAAVDGNFAQFSEDYSTRNNQPAAPGEAAFLVRVNFAVQEPRWVVVGYAEGTAQYCKPGRPAAGSGQSGGQKVSDALSSNDVAPAEGQAQPSTPDDSGNN